MIRAKIGVGEKEDAMSDEARDQLGDGDAEGQQGRGEEYESPRVDDIPTDRPAVTEPGILLVGSRDGGGDAG